jgi:uncharacterized small protein (DUF1192 family)
MGLLVVVALIVAGRGFTAVAAEEPTEQVRALQMQNELYKKTIQRLNKKIAELEKEVEALKAEAAKLKAGADGTGSGEPAKPPAGGEDKDKNSKYVVPPMRQGSVGIAVVSAHIGVVPLVNRITKERGASKDDAMTFLIAVFNLDEAKKLNYSTWGADAFKLGGSSASLGDDIGNTYKRIHYGATELPFGRRDNESVYPGKAVTDVLVFEIPVAKAKVLTLTLPLENVGGKGEVKIEIPIGAVTKH